MDGLDGRWVVVGAAGRIGVALRESLLELGYELMSIDIRSPAPLGPGDQVAQVDVRDLPALIDAFEGAVGVIHLGGLADEADFHDLADVNIVGTYHVLDAARRTSVGRVVLASSNRVTGMYPVDEHVTVDMPPRPDGFYGVSKVAGEALCSLYADKFDLSTIILRIGSYEERPGSPREQRTWLSPGDAVRAFVAAMTTPAHAGTFYAVSANEPSRWDRSAGDALGYQPHDDAAQFGPLQPIPRGTRQAGPYATAAYSLDAMRPPQR